MFNRKIYFGMAMMIFLTIPCVMHSQEQHTKEQYENTTVKQAEQTPSEYLQSAIDLIRENALNSDKINWEKATTDAMGFCEFAVTTADTYPIIRDLLEKLEDNHSHFKTPQRYKKDKYSTVEENAPMTREMLEGNIAYLNVPYVRGYTDEKNLLYATIIQDHIAALDSLNPVGWIVDLRQNTGGNMWPMLAGLGPLLGEGIHGYMVMNDGDYPWIYSNGSIGMEEYTLITLPDSGYKLTHPNLPIAVLIGSQTMSSGEAVMISFIGKENVKFFGRPTQGLSTVNVSHKLSDSAQIVLTEGVFANSSGKQYGGKIEPDVFMEDQEKTIEKAVEWILSKP